MIKTTKKAKKEPSKNCIGVNFYNNEIESCGSYLNQEDAEEDGYEYILEIDIPLDHARKAKVIKVKI